ncbi:hypothetical protein PRZ48_013093 [Zasmidium cellare]|uniref:Amino acid transporter n=1 Tax=Zasmidium cellare TaxID=395010 RepID=A0ABR0E357_ZASCE|nr:hypothetical protein PRZ48_013093 [Zasmidium cellare]
MENQKPNVIEATRHDSSFTRDEKFAATNTLHDDTDMHRMGKTQLLKRSFHSIAVLGLTCVVMGTWLGIITASSFSLINGGRAGTIWVYIATWLCSMLVIASLAEMASMSPTSGGQYFWVSEFAAPGAQKAMSYLSGWLSALGWQAFVAVAAYQAGNLILVLATLQSPDYNPERWHGTLITMAICILAVLFNAFCAKWLPRFEGAVLVLHVVGFLAVIVPLWALGPKASAGDVFTKFENNGGWASVGAACVVGQLSAASAFIGADSAAHMAEEVSDASLTVPRMMMGTIVINGVLGLVTIITFVFSIQDLQTQIVESTSTYPFIDVFRTATSSNAGAIGMTVPIIVLSIAMCINAVAAGSRQAWSFARDEGLPFRSWFTRLVSIGGTPLPLNSMLASLTISVVLSLLNLGGSAAFNSILGLVTGAVGLTYAVSISCVLWRRLFGAPLPPARWSLGRFGIAINAFSVIYEIFTVVISFFPVDRSVTAETMNWGCAMFGGVAILSVAWYFIKGRKAYKGPVVYIVKE